jgi:MFS transporter, DHA1 family, multidrug resistance protein
MPSSQRLWPTPPTWILAALAGMTALSIDMSLPAMPQLRRTFGADVANVQLTLSLFLLGYAIGQLVCGTLSDRIGRRPVLIGGLILFALSGFACALSPSLPLLIFFRFVQGMGASVGPILSRAIVRDKYESHEASGVLSQITQVMILAPVLAPTIGGYLLRFGWPSIFGLLGSVGALLFLICLLKLPETRPALHHESGFAPLARNFGVVLAHPQSRRFVLTICFSYAGMFAYISASPFVFMDGFGIAKERFGLLFALTAIALMLGATFNRKWLKHHAPIALLRRGVLIVLLSGLSLLLLTFLQVGLTGVMLPMMGYLFGLGLVQPNATASAMEPHARMAGVVSSVIGALQTLGGALAGYAVNAFYDHTPKSLSICVALLGVMTFLVFESGFKGASDST